MNTILCNTGNYQQIKQKNLLCRLIWHGIAVLASAALLAASVYTLCGMMGV